MGRTRSASQDALRQRLRELAAVRGRFGYRRLTVLLKREGWRVNAKRPYRLYRSTTSARIGARPLP
jgi:putative transposase